MRTDGTPLEASDTTAHTVKMGDVAARSGYPGAAAPSRVCAHQARLLRLTIVPAEIEWA